MNSKTVTGIFTFCFCIYTFNGCSAFKAYNESSLEYDTPPSFRMSKHNLGVASAAYRERLLNKITSVAKKHDYDKIVCNDARGIGKETDISCYRQKGREKYVIVSHDARLDFFVILMTWRGAPKDPSIFEAKADFERELDSYLGRPVTP